jgi:Holliday junction resolvase RusA-like endonuclease
MSERVTFIVYGRPVPKGSTKAWIFRGKDGRQHAATTSDSGDKLKTWDGRISTAAVEAVQRLGGPIPYYPKGSAVTITLLFTMAKPKSAKKRADPTVKPDLDKLVRGVLDPLTHVVFDDDSQVVGIDAHKVYGEPVGVYVGVNPA